MQARAASPTDATDRPRFDFDAVYREHAPFIARVIRRLLGEGPHVDDVLQETFIVAFRRQHEFEGRSALRTWLYGIASHLCIRHRRGVRRFRLFFGRLAAETPVEQAVAEAPDARLHRAEQVAIVHDAVLRLPFKQREVFVLYEIEGLDGKAIAELVGVPIGTVWRRLHEARSAFESKLKKRLNKEHG